MTGALEKADNPGAFYNTVIPELKTGMSDRTRASRGFYQLIPVESCGITCYIERRSSNTGIFQKSPITL